eukprot:scaffold33080_cov75-Phaeocystis_antarctica.AAC.2
MQGALASCKHTRCSTHAQRMHSARLAQLVRVDALLRARAADGTPSRAPRQQRPAPQAATTDAIVPSIPAVPSQCRGARAASPPAAAPPPPARSCAQLGRARSGSRTSDAAGWWQTRAALSRPSVVALAPHSPISHRPECVEARAPRQRVERLPRDVAFQLEAEATHRPRASVEIALVQRRWEPTAARAGPRAARLGQQPRPILPDTAPARLQWRSACEELQQFGYRDIVHAKVAVHWVEAVVAHDVEQPKARLARVNVRLECAGADALRLRLGTRPRRVRVDIVARAGPPEQLTDLVKCARCDVLRTPLAERDEQQRRPRSERQQGSHDALDCGELEVGGHRAKVEDDKMEAHWHVREEAWKHQLHRRRIEPAVVDLMKAVWEERLDVIVKPHSKALERSMARPAVL